MNRKLKKSLKDYDKSKQNKDTLISGELGIALNGVRQVEVSGRRGFVYVRLKGNTSEFIQAYNATVPPVYDLPVFVVRQNGIYKVVGRNIDRHQNQWGQGAYLPKHGAQHSFNHDINAGGDVAWIWSQQFMPLLSYPSGTEGGMTLSVEPHFYEWQGQWKYAQNTGTPSYAPYVPTITGSARMVLSYIDPSNNSIRLVPGTPFDNSITGSAQIAQYIPDIPRSIGIPLAAVRLVTGTTTLGWDAIYDVRDFYTPAFTHTGTIASVDTIGFVGLDEGVPLGTGTILNVTGDLSFTRSGSMFNLSYTAGGPGGGGGVGVMAWDEGIPLGTGTVFNFVGGGVTASLSGTVVQVNAENASSSVHLSSTFVITGSSGVFGYIGLEITLPNAGTYLVATNTRWGIKGSSGAPYYIVQKLYNSTDAAYVVDSERILFLVDNTTDYQGTTTGTFLITVLSSKTIQLHVARTGTFSTSVIYSNASGRTNISYIKLA